MEIYTNRLLKFYKKVKLNQIPSTPINYMANMVKSHLNMQEADSGRDAGLIDRDFVYDPGPGKSERILEGLARVKASLDPNSEVEQPSEAEVAAVDEIAVLTQEALRRSACCEIIVCRTDKGFLVLNAINQSRPEERFGIPNDSLRLSSTRQLELRKLGITFMSMAETAIRAESFPETLKHYGATVIQRFKHPS